MFRRQGSIRLRLLAVVLLDSALLGGCAGVQDPASLAERDADALREPVPFSPARQIIRHAGLRMAVEEVEPARREAERIATAAGGYLEHAHATDTVASLTLRVPATTLDETLDLLARVGEETSRTVSAEDVTRQSLDLEARLKSARDLRDRLRAHLGTAKSIAEILEVERELARVQAEVEVLEATLANLRQRIAFSRVELRLHRRRILGPLGYAFASAGWVAGKLFVIR